MEIVTDADVDPVEAVEGVHLTQEAAGDRISVQGYYFEPGAEVPEHSHEHEQAGVITSGTLTFVIDGERLLAHEGDSYVIPGGEPHAAINEHDAPVEGYDLFSPPRIDPDWAE